MKRAPALSGPLRPVGRPLSLRGHCKQTPGPLHSKPFFFCSFRCRGHCKQTPGPLHSKLFFVCSFRCGVTASKPPGPLQSKPRRVCSFRCAFPRIGLRRRWHAQDVNPSAYPRIGVLAALARPECQSERVSAHWSCGGAGAPRMSIRARFRAFELRRRWRAQNVNLSAFPRIYQSERVPRM